MATLLSLFMFSGASSNTDKANEKLCSATDSGLKTPPTSQPLRLRL